MYKWTLFVLSLTGLSLHACSDQPAPGDTDSNSDSFSGSGSTSDDNGNSGDGSANDSDPESGDSGNNSASDTTSATPAEVCPGPDSFESNDEAGAAAAIALKDGVAVFSAGVAMGDTDFFKFDAVKRDPHYIEAAYTPPAGDPSDLSLFVYNVSGTEVARHQEVRIGLSERMTGMWLAEGQGTPYVFKLESDNVACMPVAVQISAQTCTDEYEDNDEVNASAKVALNETGATILAGTPTAYLGDDDFYEFTVSATDPVLVEATYTPPPGDQSDLYLTIFDAVGQTVALDDRPRAAPTETMRTTFMPAAADALYRIKVASNQASCTTYALQVTPRACTDVFEDNETFMTAKALPMGEQVASVTKIDEDYFAVPAPGATGRCEISYTVDSTSTEDLAVYLYAANQDEIAHHDLARTGETEVIKVSWNAGEVPAFLRVVAKEESCTTYQVNCYSDR